MTNKQSGWFLGLAAFGMMLGLLALDVSKLNSWYEMMQPGFVAQCMVHISTVVAAFIGGKLIPTEPHNQREDDDKDDDTH